jgi:hypothetical protein
MILLLFQAHRSATPDFTMIYRKTLTFCNHHKAIQPGRLALRCLAASLPQRQSEAVHRLRLDLKHTICAGVSVTQFAEFAALAVVSLPGVGNQGKSLCHTDRPGKPQTAPAPAAAVGSIMAGWQHRPVARRHLSRRRPGRRRGCRRLVAAPGYSPGAAFRPAGAPPAALICLKTPAARHQAIGMEQRL